MNDKVNNPDGQVTMTPLKLTVRKLEKLETTAYRVGQR